MFARRLSRVMPALCTTMSRPTAPGARGDPRRGVDRGHVEQQLSTAEPGHHLAQSFCRLRDVDAEDGRAVPGERVGDRGADTASRAGHQGDLAGQRALRVVADQGPVPTRATWPSTYADLGERKKRSVESSCSCASGATYTRLTVAPRLTSLPSERVKPSSARWRRSASSSRAPESGRPRSRGPQRPSWRMRGRRSAGGWSGRPSRRAGRVEDECLRADLARARPRSPY